MKERPLLVIVNGLPGTGKTTLSRDLAGRLGFPLIGKDDLKESLFDSLGAADRAWSVRLGAATYALLYLIAEKLMQAGVSFVLESAFDTARDSAVLGDLVRRYGYDAVEVHCAAPRDVLLERFSRRAASAARHPGHAEFENLAAFRDDLASRSDLPLGIGPVITADTTDFNAVDFAALTAAVRARISS